ncbi:family 43 glycosylhydrolase [Arthrobacter sp. ISL-30]|nr:family 43 glycosylhydrolase [Arthrobacter sp. ISL-30]
MFSTDAAAVQEHIPSGVHIRTSEDLVTWRFLGTAVDGVPRPAREWSGAKGLWAPEVVRWPGGQWHMYYSASTFGSNTSAIGLAVAPRPAGPWEDRGVILATSSGESTQNAIDAAVTFDRDGEPWLTYGSFFSGIYTLRLDPASGRPAKEGDAGALIARRHPSVEGAIEGAFILYRREEDRYVLFTSYDSLFSTYNIRVAVAEHIEGPYRDLNGTLMTDLEAQPTSVGTKILGSYGFDGDTAWSAPGHNSVLVDGEGEQSDYYMVHHVRFAEDPQQHMAQLRRLFFTEAGWPVVSPQPFAGHEAEALDAPESLAGMWRVVKLEPSSAAVAHAIPMEVTAPAEVVAGKEYDGAPVPVRLDVAGTELDAVVFASWDWSRERSVLSFSGFSADGIAWFGTKGD